MYMCTCMLCIVLYMYMYSTIHVQYSTVHDYMYMYICTLYSGTSNKGHSEEDTIEFTSLQRTVARTRFVHFPMLLLHFEVQTTSL